MQPSHEKSFTLLQAIRSSDVGAYLPGIFSFQYRLPTNSFFCQPLYSYEGNTLQQTTAQLRQCIYFDGRRVEYRVQLAGNIAFSVELAEVDFGPPKQISFSIPGGAISDPSEQGGGGRIIYGSGTSENEFIEITAETSAAIAGGHPCRTSTDVDSAPELFKVDKFFRGFEETTSTTWDRFLPPHPSPRISLAPLPTTLSFT